MSADNYNLVKKCGGRWRAMTGLSASCEEDVQVKRGQWLGDFATRDAAIEWAEAQGYTEYGTRISDVVEPTRPSLSQLRELQGDWTLGDWTTREADDGSWMVDDIDSMWVADCGQDPGAAKSIVTSHNALPALLAIAEAAVRWRDARLETWTIGEADRIVQAAADLKAALEGIEP